MTNCEKLRDDIAQARINAIESIITGDGMADLWQVRCIALANRLKNSTVEFLEKNYEGESDGKHERMSVLR